MDGRFEVLVLVGRQLSLFESFLPFALRATSLISVIALSLPIPVSRTQITGDAAATVTGDTHALWLAASELSH